MNSVVIGDCRLFLGDCKDLFSSIPFDYSRTAVVTDPPYGIGESAGKAKTRTSGLTSGLKKASLYQKDYGNDDWDKEPISKELMDLVRSCGKYQIIFGGNYYDLPPTSCWLVWDKLNGDTDFADCELAWTNLPKAVRRIQFLWNGCMRANGETRGDHPTQKPIGVMKWCIGHLPEDSKIILDPFMGSGTTGVACAKMGKKFIGIEKEQRYFDAACRRIEEAYRQPDMFVEEQKKLTEKEELSMLALRRHFSQ